MRQFAITVGGGGGDTDRHTRGRERQIDKDNQTNRTETHTGRQRAKSVSHLGSEISPHSGIKLANMKLTSPRHNDVISKLTK